MGLGIEPKTLCMIAKSSTTKLQSPTQLNGFSLEIITIWLKSELENEADKTPVCLDLWDGLALNLGHRQVPTQLAKSWTMKINDWFCHFRLLVQTAVSKANYLCECVI